MAIYPEGLAEAAAVRMWDLLQACAGPLLRYHGAIGYGVFRAPLDIPTPAAFRIECREFNVHIGLDVSMLV
jgi:hypothetical protein